MTAFAALWEGFQLALTPAHLGWGLAGVTLGTAVGVLPGIGPALTVALLLPATYGLEPTAAFIMFAGIYYGGMYGGSTTSILLNTPGESATIVTAIDGHQMARRGRAGAALATAAIGSFVAGTLGTLALTVSAPSMVQLALAFGPADYFALIVARLRRHRHAARRVAGRRAAQPRRRRRARPGRHRPAERRGPPHLRGAVPARRPRPDDRRDRPLRRRRDAGAGRGPARPGHRDPARADPLDEPRGLARSWKPWLRGTVIGFPLGALPAGGAELPTLLSYAVERRLSRHPEEFGHGAIEGVAGPEAANNASAAGTLVPLLTLGLPASATAAVLLAAFQQFGLQAGPLLFQNEPRFVWTLLASLYIGNVLLLVLNLPLIRLWVLLLRLPTPQLYAGILVVATVGAWSVHRSAATSWRWRRSAPRLRAPARAVSPRPGDDRRDARSGRRHAPAARAGDRRGRLERAADPPAGGRAAGHRGAGAGRAGPGSALAAELNARPYAALA